MLVDELGFSHRSRRCIQRIVNAKDDGIARSSDGHETWILLKAKLMKHDAFSESVMESCVRVDVSESLSQPHLHLLFKGCDCAPRLQSVQWFGDFLQFPINGGLHRISSERKAFTVYLRSNAALRRQLNSIAAKPRHVNFSPT